MAARPCSRVDADATLRQAAHRLMLDQILASPAGRPMWLGGTDQGGASGQKVMTSRSLARLLLLLLAWPSGAAAQAHRPDETAAAYYPEAVWQRKTPAEAGFNPQRLKEAIDYAIAGESRAPRDLVMSHYQTYGREPFGYAIGPISDRGDPSGLIIRHGY